MRIQCVISDIRCQVKGKEKVNIPEIWSEERKQARIPLPSLPQLTAQIFSFIAPSLYICADCWAKYTALKPLKRATCLEIAFPSGEILKCKHRLLPWMLLLVARCKVCLLMTLLGSLLCFRCRYRETCEDGKRRPDHVTRTLSKDLVLSFMKATLEYMR